MHPRQQDVGVERLEDVVVGAELEHTALDAGPFLRCEHDDRQLRKRQIAAQLADRFVAVHLRHVEVDHHEVGVLADGNVDGLTAVLRFEDVELLLFKQ